MTINYSRFKTSFVCNLSRDGIADTCIKVVVRSGSAGVVREVKLHNLEKFLCYLQNQLIADQENDNAFVSFTSSDMVILTSVTTRL